MQLQIIGIPCTKCYDGLLFETREGRGWGRRLIHRKQEQLFEQNKKTTPPPPPKKKTKTKTITLQRHDGDTSKQLKVLTRFFNPITGRSNTHKANRITLDTQ